MSFASSGTGYSMDLLARRLGAKVKFSDAERALLAQNHSARCYDAGSTVPMPEEAALRPTLIVSGWACREEITASGDRQLMSILLPGDLIWSRCEESRPLDLLEVVAISKLTVINVASAMRMIAQNPQRWPSITRGLELMGMADERRTIEHVVRLGAQPALQRVAGVILELAERCREIGFMTGAVFVMPMTQAAIGNFVGLSVVHASRVLRILREMCVIRMRPGTMEIVDMAGLARLATDGDAQRIRFPARRPRDAGPRALEMSAA